MRHQWQELDPSHFPSLDAVEVHGLCLDGRPSLLAVREEPGTWVSYAVLRCEDGDPLNGYEPIDAADSFDDLRGSMAAYAGEMESVST